MERRGLNVRKVILGTILPLLRKLPPRLASNMVAGIGRTEYALLKNLRVRMDQAVIEVGRHFQREWNVAEISRALAGNQIRWRTRDQLLDGLADDQVAGLFTLSGRDNLDEALARKQGVVLLCNHFGSHMMPAHWLMRQGYPLRLFMERPRHISKFLAREFDTDGPLGQKKLFISRKATTAEAAGSIMRATRALNAGMIVMVAGDVRWTGANTTPARFLGKPYPFSNTWVKIACMTGAPIVPVFCRIDDSGAYELEFQPAYSLPKRTPEPEEVAAWVQDFLDRIERQVEESPANSNEYFFWGDNPDSFKSKDHALALPG